MTLKALLAKCQARGVRLVARGDQIGVSGPHTPELLAAVRVYKAPLLRCLKAGGLVGEAFGDAFDLIEVHPAGTWERRYASYLAAGGHAQFVSELGTEPSLEACPWCGSKDLWVSIYGQTVCRLCHPPAFPHLEAR